MCRILGYLGPSILISDLLYKPNSSLIKQCYQSRELNMLNLAGLGLMSWNAALEQPEIPLVYRSTAVPMYDRNLKSLTEKLETECLLAHIRGVALRSDSGFGSHNLHPFKFPDCRWALAHNGDLAQFSAIKTDLYREFKPEIATHIDGTTDSEWAYALILSQLDRHTGPIDISEMMAAIEKSIAVLARLRSRHQISQSSSFNLFMSDGHQMIGLRYTFDFGCYDIHTSPHGHELNTHFISLWYTAGARFAYEEDPGVAAEWRMHGGSDKANAILVASEPLTEDQTGWMEVPEYTALCVSKAGNENEISLRSLSIQ